MRRAPTGYEDSFSRSRVSGDVVDLDPDEVILNCYRLADRFHQNPDVFLELPISRVNAHIYYTIKLIEAQAKARRAQEAAAD